MKKKYILLLLLVCFFLFPFSPFVVRAATNADYIITQYDVNIVVNENNSFDVVETIHVYFNTPSHGISRSLPLRNNITNINSRDLYSVSNSNGNKIIKLGDPDSTSIGEKNYSIHYSYNIGNDPHKKFDAFYFNIVSDDWNTTINEATFSITMPEKFDPSELSFSNGMPITSDNPKISYSVNDNIITGNYNGTLNIGESITVKLNLPEGYFMVKKMAFDYILLLQFLTPLIFAFISFIIWQKFGKDTSIIETIELYPPEGFNSAEIGFLYKGYADKKDVLSLLLHLANKGYLRISEAEESISSNDREFEISKVKHYDGVNMYEKIFFNRLFPFDSKTTTFSTKTKSLPLSLIVKELLTLLNSKEHKEKIFEKHTFYKKTFIVIMIIISFLLITLRPMITYESIFSIISTLLFTGIGFTILFGTLFGKLTLPKPFGTLLGGFLVVVPWTMNVLPSLLTNILYLLSYITGIISITLMFFLLSIIRKRTPYGNEILGKLRGLRTFIETAESPKLESLILLDPFYFYSILPYAYVLGVSDKWIENFEGISLSPPHWQVNSSSFDMASFNQFLDAILTTEDKSS